MLFALFPGHERLKALTAQRGTDGLSIVYMQLLLRTHPGDTALRWALAQKQVALGKWRAARNTLTPLLAQPGESGQQARLAALEIDFSLANALSIDKRDSVFAKIIGQVEILSSEVLRPPALARLAQISLAVNRPDLAARLRRKLAELDPTKRLTWLELAAQSYLACGAAISAGLAYQDAAVADRDDGVRRRKYTLLALDAFLNGKAGKEAFALAEIAVAEWRGDREILQRSVASALLQNELERGRQWGRQLLALTPDEPAMLTQQVDAELAAGDFPAALSSSLHLVALDPENVVKRMRLAHIAEAAAQHPIALEQWLWLTRRNPTAEALDHALRLAAARRDDVLWIELASRSVQLRPLEPQQVAQVKAIGTRRKAPKKLLDFLEGYVKRYPAERAIWEVLAHAQEQLGDLSGARATWQLMNPYLISAEDSARHQARLLTRGGRTPAAGENQEIEDVP